MTSRVIREDSTSAYISLNGVVFRPHPKFDASAKKRVGTRVEVRQSASRVFGTMVFLTVPEVEHSWAWAPEKYRGAKPVDPVEFQKEWGDKLNELLNSKKSTVEVLLGWMGGK